MGDFSKPPLDVLQANLAKGYVGLHIEQGVPILDRDLNLLNDLITATVRSVFARYIGNGLPTGVTGFAVQATAQANDFLITGPGRCLVGGLEVTIPATLNYASQKSVVNQPPLAPLTTPNASHPNPREDIVYLDVWLAEVNGTTDEDLRNSTDIGVQTSVRQKPIWLVRVAEGVPVPNASIGHAHYELARLIRPSNEGQITGAMIRDLRQIGLTLVDVVQRLNLLERALLLPTFNPSPNQFSPKVGNPEQSIVLFGRNFNIGTVQVQFGTVAATVVGAPTANQIVVKVPTGITGATKIRVITDGGVVVSDDTFTVLPPLNQPAFAASPNQFSPKLGSAGQTVTLSGSNFNVGTVQVQVGTVAATIVGAPSANQIVITVPTGVLGGVKITVITGVGSVASDDTFTGLPPVQAPTFAASPNQFSPKVGSVGQNISLFGNNFNVAPVQVQFGNTNATIVGTPTATQIVATVPTGATGGLKIRVTTGGGTVVSDDTCTVL